MLLLLTPNVFGQPATNLDSNQAKEMDDQLMALAHQGQWTQALALSLEALKFSKEKLGPECQETALRLNDLGDAYRFDARRRNYAPTPPLRSVRDTELQGP